MIFFNLCHKSIIHQSLPTRINLDYAREAVTLLNTTMLSYIMECIPFLPISHANVRIGVWWQTILFFFFSFFLERFISNRRGVWLVCIITIFYRNVFKANSVDPDQTPRSAASDLGIHCLPMSLLWETRLKWVNMSWLSSVGSGFGPVCFCHIITSSIANNWNLRGAHTLRPYLHILTESYVTVVTYICYIQTHKGSTNINPFSPDFMKWTLPSLLWTHPLLNIDRFQSRINNRTANSVDPDETARYRLIWIYTVCKGIFLVRKTEELT